MRTSVRVRSLALSILALAALGCASAPRYPRRAVVWNDPDRAPFAPRPAERWVPYYWDATDNLFFRPVADALALSPRRESIDVNALDEVPDSSWFVNRIGRHAMSPREVALGACDSIELDAPGPWTITGGKPSGASPGFFIRDANGVSYLLKTDRVRQPEQSTAADAIVASIYAAAGYHVPCNRVVFFDPSIFEIEEGALARVGERRRLLTPADVDRVSRAAAPGPDGLRRAVLSRFVDARPIGPWSYVGVLEEDPNDAVPHEDRREVRALFVLNAWVDHWDARQENTLAGWVEQGEGGYVRHYLIDFGEALGLRRGNHRNHPRMGHTTYLDLGTVLEDVLSLGLVRRPWDGRTEHAVLGYFDAEPFEPDGWRPNYWNGALERMTERDAAWAARIVARFTDTDVDALVPLGRYTDPEVEARLARILKARRDRILERYLRVLSPLADPSVDRDDDGHARVCLSDLAVRAGIRPAETRARTASARMGERAVDVALSADADRVCITFDDLRGEGGPDDYLVLDVQVATPPEATRPARLHFYVAGEDELELVGLQRL